MIKKQLIAPVFAALVASAACSSPIVQSAASAASAALVQADAQRYVADYERNYQQLYYASSLAEWDSNTRIVEGDTTNAARTKAANEAFARFAGSVENINRIRGLLENRQLLTPLQVRQLEAML
jgi:peptidyl-dipeptidase A